MKSVRFKMILTLVVVTIGTLAIMQVFNAFLFARDPKVVVSILPMFFAVSGTITFAACALLAFKLRRLPSVLRRIGAGESVPQAERLAERKAIAEIPILVIVMMAVGFFIGPILSMVGAAAMGGSATSLLRNALIVALNLAFGFMAGLQTIFLMDGIMIEPINKLDIESINALKPEISTSSKIMLIGMSSVFLGLLMMGLTAIGSILDAQIKGAPISIPRLLTEMAVVAAVVLSWAAFLTRTVGSGMKKQLAYLNARLAEFAAGGGDLRRRASILHRDEFGELTSSLNTFMETLRGMLSQIRESAGVVAGSARSLTDSAENASQSVDAMEEAVGRVSQAISRQAESVSATETRIGSLSTSIDAVGQQVSTQAGFVEESSASIEEMVANIISVSRMTQQADDLSAKLQQVSAEGDGAIRDTAASMGGISEASQAVSAILKTIQKISSQTNLLAMNAAIEAAHAGTAGRGFAVVADEVRSLAESSAKSAKDIVSLIKDMNSRIEQGVRLGQQASEAFVRISKGVNDTANLVKTITGAMSEQKIGADEILASIQHLIEATQKIKELSAEQKEESVKMKDAMSSIVEVSALIDEAVQEEISGNKTIARVVSVVAQEAQRNKDTVAALDATVNRFSV